MRRPASEKYREAIQLYRTTDLSITEISRRCGMKRAALSSYILRCHRDLMYLRHGLDPTVPVEKSICKTSGQRPETREKYRDAILACDSEKYIELNISQIARIFHLDPTQLSKQLRVHFPEILERREAERQRLGISGNAPRGARKTLSDLYAPAVEMLRKTDLTIGEVADRFNISPSGLKQHLIYYHHGLIDNRAYRRIAGKENPTVGRMGGNGHLRVASSDKTKEFAEAVRMYASSPLTANAISKITGVDECALRNHLRQWHRSLIFKRRGLNMECSSGREPLLESKRYSQVTAEKYADAIAHLKSNPTDTVENTARKFKLRPDLFRKYIHEHEPDIWQRMGMTELDNGRKVLRRSNEKYAEAIHAFRTSDESLRSIASRLGLQYKSLSSFIKRNYPDAVEEHHRNTGKN